MHKTVFGSFTDKRALSRQLLRLKDYYYKKRLGQENRQLPNAKKWTRQSKLKANIRRHLPEVMTCAN